MGPQPRSAGFNYGWVDRRSLRESLEARRFTQQICEELTNGPAIATQDHKTPPEHRKHSIKTVFSSRFKRKLMKEDKMPVSIHRTPDDRKYKRILSKQVYDINGNASTYRVNQSRLALNSQLVNGSQEPVNGCLGHSSLGNGKAQRRLLPYQIAGSPNPTSVDLGNRFLNEVADGNIAAERNEATLESSSRKSTTEDSLGLLRDLSQILSGGQTTPLATGASRVPIPNAPPKAEDQPRIHDFAGNSAAPLSRARAASRGRSRNPVKAIGGQTESLVTTERPPNAAAYGGQSTVRLGRSPNNSISFSPMTFGEPPRPPLAPSLPMNHEHVLRARISPVMKYHSKEPSLVSAESIAEDILSDASSGVVSNAQSAIFVKVPPQPGPAPLIPLPSLPEGFDNSQSSRRLGSPESSPSKLLPQKPPARSQYKSYPSVDTSPPRTRSATEPEHVMTRPPRSLRSDSRGFPFPQAECLATSTSVGTLDELEQWKEESTENTIQKQSLDMDRRSHKATASVDPVTRSTIKADRYHEAVAERPNRMDLSGSTFPQASKRSSMSVSTTIPNLDSSTLSQKLSPIIVIAEQEPTSPPMQQVSSQRSQFISRGTKINGFHPEPPHLASSPLQQPEYKNEASRVPTSRLSPLLQGPSYHSIHELSGLEERLFAIERKNAMLQRAFLAVLDTSASFGDSGKEGTNGTASNSISGRGSDRSSRLSGTGSLYTKLENVLALHSGIASSSGP